MNDNDIIKALGCCKDRRCGVCDRRYGYHAEESICRLELIDHALDLINHQKAEIERLKEENQGLKQELSYAPKYGTIGDSHEMGAW